MVSTKGEDRAFQPAQETQQPDVHFTTESQPWWYDTMNQLLRYSNCDVHICSIVQQENSGPGVSGILFRSLMHLSANAHGVNEKDPTHPPNVSPIGWHKQIQTLLL